MSADETILEMMNKRMDRFEEKLDKVLENLVSAERVAQLEGRVGELEKWRAWVMGAGVAAGAVAGFVGHIVGKLIAQ